MGQYIAMFIICESEGGWEGGGVEGVGLKKFFVIVQGLVGKAAGSGERGRYFHVWVP